MSINYIQGELDGLCGVYSLVNSVSNVLNLSYFDSHRYFSFLTEELTIHKPSGFSKGLFYTNLKYLTSLTKEYFPSDNLNFYFGFQNKKFNNKNDFFNKLGSHLNNKNACAIIGFEEPWAHWTVAKYITDHSIKLIDSASKPNKWARIKSIEIDKKKKSSFYISTRSTIIINGR